ncbi:cupredoxin domain-containing protein [Modestobacter sp. SSW1-42]|uniref:cupredoxin domain-containing protein n=1 Tax=Modestobacter sp. SSW1-42 TaxID=596372 RepID=UPI0039870A1A
MNSAAARARGTHRTTLSRGPAGVLLSGALVLAVLTGCSDSEPTLPEVTRATSADAGVVRTAPDGVQEVTLETGDDYAFTPATFTVAPGPVRLTVRNTAKQLTHNFLFTKGKGPEEITEQIPFLGPGDSKTIAFTATAPGDHPFECSFHLALGQVGTMTVSAP